MRVFKRQSAQQRHHHNRHPELKGDIHHKDNRKRTKSFFKKLLTNATKLAKVNVKPCLEEKKFTIPLYDILYHKEYAIYGSTVLTGDIETQNVDDDYDDDDNGDSDENVVEEEGGDSDGDTPIKDQDGVQMAMRRGSGRGDRRQPTLQQMGRCFFEKEAESKIGEPTLTCSSTSPMLFWQTLSKSLPNVKYFFDMDVQTDAIYWVSNCSITRCLVLWWLSHNPGTGEGEDEENAVWFTKDGNISVRKKYSSEHRRSPRPLTSANARRDLLRVLPTLLFDHNQANKKRDMPEWIKGGRGAQIHINTSTTYDGLGDVHEDQCLELRLRPDVVMLSEHSNADMNDFQNVTDILKHENITLC